MQNLCTALVPSVAMCDARDVAGACVFLDTSGAGETTGARLYIYDTCPNGVGLAAKAGRLLITNTRPTLFSYEPFPRVCTFIHPEGISWGLLRIRPRPCSVESSPRVVCKYEHSP